MIVRTIASIVALSLGLLAAPLAADARQPAGLGLTLLSVEAPGSLTSNPASFP